MKGWVLDKLRGLLAQVDREIAKTLGAPDADHIHDLRTSIRRTRESVRVFAQFLPGRKVRNIRRELRTVMHLAAEIRNRDVVLELLANAGVPGMRLQRGLEAQRASSLEHLLNALTEMQHSGGVSEWVAKTKTGGGEGEWKPKRTAAENAAALLPLKGTKYWKAGGRLLGKHLDFETLHRFRLKTKRYRYTLELFREIDPQVEAELKRLKPVQDLLGEINDCATALELIDRTSRKHRKLAQYLHERAAKKIAKLDGVLNHTSNFQR